MTRRRMRAAGARTCEGGFYSAAFSAKRGGWRIGEVGLRWGKAVRLLGGSVDLAGVGAREVEARVESRASGVGGLRRGSGEGTGWNIGTKRCGMQGWIDRCGVGAHEV